MGYNRAFSAPGKALLVGGYLVLDSRYKAYVIALSSRMHAVVSAANEANAEGSYRVLVTSAQFNDDQWSYTVSKKEGFLPAEDNNRTNPFIEQVIFNVFNYFFDNVEQVPNVIRIQIFSDPEYHSQENTYVVSNKYKHFNFHKKGITDVPKTGLGSSAGLVTVLTAALCSVLMEESLTPLNATNAEHLKIVHNLAQVAHCQAQGKIGSGFDVAAATYGSILYNRFAPDLVSDLPKMNPKHIRQYHRALVALVERIDWNISTERIKLPRGLKLIMGDVNSGSETVKLVAKVKRWYQENLPRSLEIYEKINDNNMKVIVGFSKLNQLSETNPEYYKKILESLIQPSGKKYVELEEIQDAVNTIREQFRIITQESGADVEPSIQTELLDACMNLKGVLTGVVPGAGGYDAISLIATENTELFQETENREDFKNVSWLKIKQADLGLMEEDYLHYKGLE
ncbi:hypothetical protein KAFR_0B03290 [Kazachstania africana CBS 2517]|uniref:Phosphomevalonate kinase n=1 Tax=Kazachstania africana (strain ATCC 22294 / BCRC 22015 / CBS 2517 / CECT 1963 / NBRC 1671 / NRRL Y-8276) TaxID=1071382 RepID=H2AQH6_KAZAF|nr:hypothetical protein KAFR_0B03290 [Kazachstania africana CBS 2517]CCF56626.1 hypothetical protein KAFR_0B03290 [Kazachstania africana CBS 2517]